MLPNRLARTELAIVRALLLKSGLSKTNIQLPKKRELTNISSDWVQNKLIPACQGYERILCLLSEEVWGRYILNEMDDLREVVMRREAEKNILKFWKLRPDELRKKKRGHKKDKTR